MPFIRYVRDKRGYEHTYVMHGYRAGQGAARARVLYLFRSPPNMQIGRKSMDAEVREALEHTHPDLTFDWDGLLREPMPPPRPDPRERGPRQRSQGRKEKPGREAAPQPSMPVIAHDETLLGRTLGASDAARVRGRYAELNHRIGRRARTPEERERLLEAAQGLNPEHWTDEAAIRAGAAGLDRGCDAILAELPRRRRGRRGGKGREDAGAGIADQDASPDVIIGRDDDPDDQGVPVALAAHDAPADSNPRDLGNPGGHDERPSGPAAESAEAPADAGAGPADIHEPS